MSFLQSLKPNPKTFAKDAVAGFSTGLFSIPEGMAYAQLPSIEGAENAVVIFRASGREHMASTGIRWLEGRKDGSTGEGTTEEGSNKAET